MEEEFQDRRILRRTEVEEIVGISRSTLYSMVAEGRFPRPIRIGRRAVGWRWSHVKSWLDAAERSYDLSATE